MTGGRVEHIASSQVDMLHSRPTGPKEDQLGCEGQVRRLLSFLQLHRDIDTHSLRLTRVASECTYCELSEFDSAVSARAVFSLEAAGCTVSMICIRRSQYVLPPEIVFFQPFSRICSLSASLLR
jgi:hypothetical protein